jgi:hypothetical protein
MQPLFPEVHVELVGMDGNAYAILGRCQQAARRAGLSQTEIRAFFDEAMRSDYDNLLATCVRWFDVT